MKALLGVVVLAAFMLFGSLSLAPSSARFVDPASVPANTLTADTLNAPTGLNATGGTSVTLNWTATADAYAAAAPPKYFVTLERGFHSPPFEDTPSDHDELVRRGIWKGPQKERVHHAEDGGVRADAERQRRNRDGGE